MSELDDIMNIAIDESLEEVSVEESTRDTVVIFIQE